MGIPATAVKRRTEVASVVILVVICAVLVLTCAACARGDNELGIREDANMTSIDKVIRTEKEWKSILPPERYRVLREKGTEPPYSGEYDEHWGDGVYHCYACDLPLFDSTTKFHSGSGWPSFWKPIGPDAVEEHSDTSLGMIRVEVVCARCGGHLGHVFDDGPLPSNLRYCINSLSLRFRPR